MTTEQKDSILNRIKKLLNMTEARGATPAEAANAAAKAQALLFEHNLSMSTVDAFDDGKKPEGIDKNIYDMKDGKDSSMAWRRSLLNVVTRYNFCKLVTNVDGYGRRTAIIGKPSNVAVAIYIYEHVQNEIHLMGKAFQKLQTYNKSMFYTSFCIGAVTTITQRLKEQEETQQAQNSKCTALVVVSHQQLVEATKRFFPVLRTGRSGPSVKRADGYEAGREAGRHISLNRGVGNSSTPTRRIS